MIAALQNLLKLQALEFGETATKNLTTQVAELRALIPPQILGHYDRLRARDKKGVAVVRNQVCTGCHMKQPLAKIMIVMRGEDLQLCDTCGRYLSLPEPPEAALAEVAEAPKPVEKPAPKRVGRPRKQKALEPAA